MSKLSWRSIKHLNSVLRAIRNVNQLIAREKDRCRLVQGACDSLIGTRGYYNAWITLLDDSGKFLMSAESGLGDAFSPMAEKLKNEDFPICAQKALKQSELVINENPPSDCLDCPLSENHAGRGAVTTRFEYGGKVYGWLSISIPKNLIYDEQEQSLFRDVAIDLAFALHDIEIEEKHKQANEKLKSSENKLRELFNNMSSGVAVYEARDDGQEFVIVDINRAGERIEKVKKEDLIGRSVVEAFPGVKDFGLLDVFQRVWKTGKPEHHPISMYKDERISGWRENYVYKLPSGEIVAVYDDVTKQKQAEEALRESREKYRQLVENANEAIFVAQDGMIKFLNHKLIEILGYSEEELTSKPFVKFIHPEDRDMVLERHLKRLKGEEFPHVYYFRFIDKDRNIKWTEINAVSVSWEGKPATLNFLTDVTERRKMEEELQKIEKLESVGVLAGGIAHDFNNLLTAILGNISLANMYSTEERITERLVEAEKASLRARDLTQQLLTFAKGGEPIKQNASISELLKDTTEFALRGSNVECTFAIPNDLWAVKIDKGQISQVIQNLVINANSAMPTGGILKIKAENTVISDKDNLPLKEGKYIKISVEDEGIGIPKEYLTKIFDPYFTTKDKGPDKGTGLGLAICYSIIEKHDGYITVESEPGVGTTFYIYLPAFQKELVVEEKVEEQPLAGKGKILVMDDEETVRNVAKAILVHLGYDVELAENGAEAIEFYQKAKDAGQPFDAAILDLTIPGGMGGRETIGELLKLNPEVKALVSSGYSNDPIMSDPGQYGFSGAVAKPYNIKELGETLRRIISY